MNAARRKEIDRILALIETVSETVMTIKSDIETVRDEEQEYFDNMPDSLQSGDKGTTAEEAINNLEEAMNMLDMVDMEELHTFLENAKG